MALRLSRPSDDAPDQSKRTSERIDARAQACIAAGDLKGYRELFAHVAGVDDPHRRYQARRTLVEQGLAAASGTPSKDVPALFLAVARSAVELLEEEPREPILLNYTGVALYELGSLDAAEKLFKACRRLGDTGAPPARRHVRPRREHPARDPPPPPLERRDAEPAGPRPRRAQAAGRTREGVR